MYHFKNEINRIDFDIAKLQAKMGYSLTPPPYIESFCKMIVDLHLFRELEVE